MCAENWITQWCSKEKLVLHSWPWYVADDFKLLLKWSIAHNFHYYQKWLILLCCYVCIQKLVCSLCMSYVSYLHCLDYSCCMHTKKHPAQYTYIYITQQKINDRSRTQLTIHTQLHHKTTPLNTTKKNHIHVHRKTDYKNNKDCDNR